MKLISSSLILACMAVAFNTTVPVYSAEEEKGAPAKGSEAKDQDKATEAPVAADDFGDFGSDDPIERPDMPTRGVLSFLPKDGVANTMDHWLQFDWKFKAKRSGHYLVRLNYRLDHATLGVQFKLGETRLRKLLTSAPSSRRTYLGEIFVVEPSDQIFSVYAPSTANGAGFDLLGIDLVPTKEGESKLTQAEDGSVTLLAKNATTWSVNMRYESKPEKNCLGYWTEPDDFAEWEFDVKKPGKYEVIVSHGCGGGNEGSEVVVRLGKDEKKFTVKDTGGFQKWQDIKVGEISIKEAGTQRLVIDPVNKKKAAVLDVQKVILKPLS